MRLAAVLACALGAARAYGQKYTPEPPPLISPPCKPTKKVPCLPAPAPAPAAAPATPEAFPFPGEEESKPPATPQTGNPAQGAFPFPGEPAPEPPAASSSSSSSSSSSDPAAPDPDETTPKDEGPAGSTRFSRKRLPKVKVIDPDEREAKDLEVSHYYFSTGNFDAAYLRAKDAVSNVPEDPEAHLALAEAAQHLNKAEEATAEYNLTLKLDVSEQQKKAAHKGLTELAAAPRAIVR